MQGLIQSCWPKCSLALTDLAGRRLWTVSWPPLRRQALGLTCHIQPTRILSAQSGCIISNARLMGVLISIRHDSLLTDSCRFTVWIISLLFHPLLSYPASVLSLPLPYVTIGRSRASTSMQLISMVSWTMIKKFICILHWDATLTWTM